MIYGMTRYYGTNPVEFIETGDYVKADGKRGVVRVIKM